MRWAEGFIAVDWGTTNRRAFRIGADGRCAEEFEDRKGILAVPPGTFGAAAAEIRSRLGDLPLLLAGMVGSNRGWVEAAYVDAPAGAEEIAAHLTRLDDERAAIIPGVAFRHGTAADVMRGEEVQIVGAVAAGLVSRSGLVCHPGTHNKWVRIADGRIASFRTVMTGELFNLLKEHSILADLLAQPTEDDDSFAAGVRHGLDRDDLVAELFSVRARFLLGETKREAAAPYVSGLLIGSDLRLGLRDAPDGELVAMGRPELTRLYGSAIRIAGRSVREVDGEQAFLAGVARLAELIE